MKKILAFGASSSINSINKKLASYAAKQIKDVEIRLLDLNEFEMPIFSVDTEANSGIPDLAVSFKKHISETDGIIISFAEHNGSYTAAFKNILDWFSRVDQERFENKPVFIMGTSPGGRGAASVMAAAKGYLPFMKANIVAEFSLPKFSENFDDDQGLTNSELKQKFQNQLKKFVESF